MDLRDYVAYYRTHGYTDEQLEEHLVHQGYKEEEVKAALNAGKVPWVLISVIAVVMLLFGVGIFFFMSTLSDVTQMEVPREVTLQSLSPASFVAFSAVSLSASRM